MKDYARIVTRINSSLWLMTEDAINQLLGILERHMFEDDEEIRRYAALFEDNGNGQEGPQIINGVGILNLEGPIFPKANLMTEMSGATSLETFRNDLRNLVGDDSVGSVLVNIDSPGGVSDLVMEAGRDIRDARDFKPVITIANTMAASAALWLASQGNEFYITPSGITGSLGAYTVHIDYTEMDKKEGITKTVIKAGEAKAAGEEPLNPVTRANLQAAIDDLYGNFVDEVALGRGLQSDYVKDTFGHGGIVTPKEAMRIGMVDGIETYETILGEMTQNGGVVGRASTVAAAKALSSRGYTISYSGDRVWLSDNTGNYRVFEPDKEHGDVGTQGEPIPKEPQMEGDPAVVGGWRVPSDAQPSFPPAEHQPPPVVKGSRKSQSQVVIERSAMTREQLEALANRLNIVFDENTTDEELFAEISSEVDDVVVPLNEAALSAGRVRAFADEFPEEYEKYQKLLRRDEEHEARAFASRWERFKIGDGETSTRGFAARVLTQIEDLHLKMARKQVSESDIAELLDSIAETGSVDYSEKGSARDVGERVAVEQLDIKEVRTLFADEVKSTMEQDGVDRKTAVKLVGDRNPELAAAYKSGHVRR